MAEAPPNASLEYQHGWSEGYESSQRVMHSLLAALMTASGRTEVVVPYGAVARATGLQVTDDKEAGAFVITMGEPVVEEPK